MTRLAQSQERFLRSPRAAACLAAAALPALGIAVACTTERADAVVPGENGQIAFSSARDGGLEVYVINPDGSGQTNLTKNTVSDSQPAWSPDGTKIAFISSRNENPELYRPDVYVMNADGSAQTRLTNNTANESGPTWSPDGTKIAFERFYELWVMNADGTGETRLTNNAASDYAPSWSPDGTKIAFESDRDENAEVYVMNADGSGQTNISNNAARDYQPAWSPDGTKIAFTRFTQVYVMNADGTGQTRLTNSSAIDSAPAWSPDGTKIAFNSDVTGSDITAAEVYVMNADGTGQTRLTNGAGTTTDPDWGVPPRPGVPPLEEPPPDDLPPGGNRAGPPELTVDAAPRQLAEGPVLVNLTSDENADVLAKGAIVVRPGQPEASAVREDTLRFKLKVVRKQVIGDETKRFKLRPEGTKRQAKRKMKRIDRKAEAGADVRAKIKLVATDARGNTSTAKVVIRLL